MTETASAGGTRPPCRGCGRPLIVDLERAVLTAVLARVKDPNYVVPHQEAYLARRLELDAAHAERRTALERERQEADATLQRSLVQGVMDGFATERVVEFRKGLQTRLRQIAVELALPDGSATPPDARTVPQICDALETVLANSPFRGTDIASAACVRIVRKVVPRIEVGEPGSDGSALLRIWLNPGPLIGQTEDDADASLWETIETVLKPTGDVDHRSRAKDAAYAAAGGDVREDIWTTIRSLPPFASESVAAFGWDLRNVADAARFCMVAVGGDLEVLPERFGPREGFLGAAEAFVRSGAFQIVARELQAAGCPYPDLRRFVSGCMRPTDEQIAERMDLQPKPDDPPFVVRRLRIAAAAMDGVPAPRIAELTGTSAATAEEVAISFRAGGASALRRVGPLDAEHLTIEALLQAADEANNPDFELRLRMMAALYAGADVMATAKALRCTDDAVRHWRQLYLLGGAEALRGLCWKLRHRPLQPGPTASAASATLDALRTDVRGEHARRTHAVALYLAGATGAQVAKSARIELPALRAALLRYRVKGVAGFGIAGRDADARDAVRLRDVAERVTDVSLATRLCIVAEFLDGSRMDALALKHACQVGSIAEAVISWHHSGSPFREPRGLSCALFPREAARLQQCVDAGVDPDHPDRPINYVVLQRICQLEFGKNVSHLALRTAHGFKIRGRQKNAYGRKAEITGFVEDAFEDDDG